MTLEISLRHPLVPPRFLQARKDEPPRDVHWVGQTNKKEQSRQSQGGKNEGGSKSPDPRGYRDLSTITLGEVNDAYKYFVGQLAPAKHESWIGTNYFCLLHLIRKKDGRPPAIFGRVKTCYPSDGYIHNIQDLELLFPRKDGSPDVLLLHAEDILSNPSRPVQGYCVRVKFLVSEEDVAEFTASGDLFARQGFLPDFHSGYLDLLELSELDHGSLPWMYVVGSRWFASVPASVQPEVRAGLQNLIRWNKIVFNYHPESLPSGIKTLNRELGFKAGFTKTFLIEPETPQQTARIVASAFDAIFKRPMVVE